MPDNVGSLPPAVGDASPARHAGRNITPAEAVVHLMKGNLGPGVLALPLQFVRVGPSIGLCILAVVGVQGVYCMWLIVATQHAAHFRGRASGARRVPSTKALSFEDLGWLAFGTPGRCVVQAAVCVLQARVSLCPPPHILVAPRETLSRVPQAQHKRHAHEDRVCPSSSECAPSSWRSSARTSSRRPASRGGRPPRVPHAGDVPSLGVTRP